MNHQQARAEVKKWVGDSLSRDLLQMMHVPEERSETAKPNAVVGAARKVLHYENHIADLKGVDQNVFQFLREPVECASHDDLKGVGVARDEKQLFLMGLVEVMAGAYRMTPEQYAQVQRSDETVHYQGEMQNGAWGLHHISMSRPLEALKKIEFDEFKQIAAEVLQERDFPLELPKTSIALNELEKAGVAAEKTTGRTAGA